MNFETEFEMGQILALNFQTYGIRWVNTKFLEPLCCKWHTSMPEEFLEHSIPDYLVRGSDHFSLRLSNKNNDNSQPHTNCAV